jgi:hypothetical protein
VVSGCQKLSSFAASAMEKCLRNICDDEIEELVFYSDSEAQYTTDESEYDSTNDLSGDTDDIITENEEWHEKRREDRALVHHFTAHAPGLIRGVAPNISGESSPFDCFTLMFMNVLFNTIVTETNC